MNKKTENLRKLKGKYIGAGIKLNNHEYGHKKAKDIAISKAIMKKKYE